VPASAAAGLVAVRLRPRRIGTTLLTVRNHGTLVGRLRLRIVKAVRAMSRNAT
jgi:hypothetical protein